MELVIRKVRVVPLQPSDEYRFSEEEPIVIGDEDRDLFLALLDNPLEPPDSLKRAMAASRTLLENQ
ncbi:hypothetical protein FRUB_04369 [Fimbriiglobus ruber]|uniref:DUF1778 domain-containing protein n=1 Tax=Fimbriiglobus ruber TaxID=1908690 RepID=A0A225DLJ9_9BACT|nr:hypothetical protein FRUB_04369 [Fimbriiglobus ruber]